MEQVFGNTVRVYANSEMECREESEELRKMVGLLVGKDRMLMTMYIDNGNSFRQIARLAGVAEERIARRIRRVTKRLMNGQYLKCLWNSYRMNKNDMDIAKDYFLSGLSIKKIATKRETTYYSIYRTIRKIRGIIKSEHGIQKMKHKTQNTEGTGKYGKF